MNETQRLQLIDRYWRAANYLAAGQIFLCDNPLLERPNAQGLDRTESGGR